MKYPLDFERVVGFDVIRQSIRSRCKYESTETKVDDWAMQTDYNGVLAALDLLDEIQRLYNLQPSVFQFGGRDITDLKSLIDIENFMLEEEWLGSIAQIVQGYVKLSVAVQSKRDDLPMMGALLPVEAVEKQILGSIGRILDDFGEISVRATPQYAKINQEIYRLEGEARQVMRGIFRDWKAQGFTAETDVTVREERLVIPVIAEFKRRVKGFVKDISATGKIFYIEPTQMLEMNNRLKELLAEKRRERERILRLITAELRPFNNEMQSMMRRLVEVDFLMAKWHWCAMEKAQRPKVSESPQLMLRQACHPVLRKDLLQRKLQIIPLNLSLNNQRIMVVSGPNAGGKSVVLKTVLLLQYMVQCGLFVTADAESRFGLFEYLGIDCGDGQDLQQGLSTFSAHLKHLNNLLSNASDKSLIGMDEIGAGTDPRFGAPIAQAVLEKLLSAGSFVIATTHFSQLREWGMGISEVVQASMSYDVAALKPLYHLVMGKPGSSFALELMRKTGFDAEWIDRIKLLAGKQMGKTEDLMLELEKQNQQLIQQVGSYAEKLQHLENMTESYHQLKDKLQSKRQEYLLAARQEAKKLLANTNQQIENTIRTIREHGAAKDITMKARQSLQNFKQSVETDDVLGTAKKVGLREVVNGPIAITNVKQLIPGALVMSSATETQGEVLEIKKDRAWVVFGVIKMWVPISELMLVKH